MECPSPSNCCLSSRSQRLNLIRSSLQARCNLKRDRRCFFPSARAVYLAATIERIRFDAEGWRGDKYPRWRHGQMTRVGNERDERGKGKREERDELGGTRIRGIAFE